MPPTKIADRVLRFFTPNTNKRKLFITMLEIVFIVAWAIWVGRSYLKLDPYSGFGRGNDDFLISIYPYFPLTRLLHCGDCVLWNGLINGGSPTFGDTIGALFHPVMAPLILFFGVLNGIKLAMLAALIMGGLALWWLAKVLDLGIVPRLWIAMLGVVGGNLAGPLYSGDVGVVFSVAATGLAIAPGLNLALHGRRRDAIIFGVFLAQAVLSGQGYLQIALVLCLLPVFLCSLTDSRFRLKPIWKEFIIAGVIAILVSAIFWLPALSLASKVVKPSPLATSQPLEYSPINLVIRDLNFFLSPELQKLVSPNLYINYIGWIPIVFAILAWRLIPRKYFKVYISLVIGIFLIYLLASTPFLGWIRGWLDNLTTDVVNPIFGIELAVTLILGLGAWGLDLILKLRWPCFEITENQEKTLYKVDTRILLVPILIWAIVSVYQFNNQFRSTIGTPSDIAQAAKSISPTPAGWTHLNENWAFTAAVINDNIKITDVYRIWGLKDRPNPKMFLNANLDAEMKNDSHYVRSLGPVYFLRYPENPYAYIDTGSGIVPCSASADGGHIDVNCQTDNSGILTVQENALPGWAAWLDNKKVELLPGQWLSVNVSAGKHTLKFRYHPWDVPLGLLVSIVGLGLAIWLWSKPQAKSADGLISLNS